jgi:dolichyl-phosphate-mannose-protein mannosyltransferase
MHRTALIILLLSALTIRIWAMEWPPFPYDMQDWIAWGERIREVGPGGFYNDAIFADYAPGYLYVLWVLTSIKHELLPNASAEVVYNLYRLPAVLFDLATTALIFAILEHARQTCLFERAVDTWVPVAGAAAYAFNPAIIFNSAIWGQVDATFAFGAVLTLALLLWNRVELAVACYVVALLIKPQAISLAPLIGLFVLLRYPWRRWLKAGLLGAVVALVMLIPFFGWRAFLGLIDVMHGSVETYPYTSLFSYNLWGIYGVWEDDTLRIGLGLSLRSAGLLLYGVGLIYGIWFTVRCLRGPSARGYAVFALATYFAFLPVMVLTRMHERYLFPVLPLLLLFTMLYQIERSPHPQSVWLQLPVALYGFVTLLHTVNLYQVYVYYLHYDQGGVDRSNTLYYLIADNVRLWSALMLLLFAIIVVYLPSWLRKPAPVTSSQQSHDKSLQQAS